MAHAVITRDSEAAARYAAALAPLGLDAIAMPVTRTAPPRDPDQLARALGHGGYAAIVVASVRAAEALDAARGDAVLPEVWAVGPATARALAAVGIAARLPDGVRDAASLAAAVIARHAVSGRRVLVPRAEDGRDEAISALRAAGAEVDAIAAYRTVATTHDDPAIARGLALLRAGDAAVCAVFAPSQVAALAELLGGLAAAATVFAAIGDTTAAALRGAGAGQIVGRIVVADAATPDRLANAVAAVYPPTS